jgi:hypothetical protein
MGEVGNEHDGLDVNGDIGDIGDIREHGDVGRLVVNMVNGGAVTGGRHARDVLQNTIVSN